MKLPLVKVEWGDAWSQWGWVQGEILTDAHPVLTTGYMVEKSKKGVVIVDRVALDKDKLPSYGNMSFIPKGMIYKITRIKGEYVEVAERY